MIISSWLNFGRPAPLGRGSPARRKFWASPYYSQLAVFASLWVLFCLQYCNCSSQQRQCVNETHRFKVLAKINSHMNSVLLKPWTSARMRVRLTADKKRTREWVNFCQFLREKSLDIISAHSLQIGLGILKTLAIKCSGTFVSARIFWIR